jgi:phosphoenolpyruvate synthase/pyruvate phosphate dikinase
MYLQSVVSASIDPDTIILSVDIESNSLSKKRKIKEIESTKIGSKSKSIKVNHDCGFGIQEFETTDPKTCCISVNEAVTLGEIGLEIHAYHESPRDIEWGIKNNKLYLFQSRPITNLDSMSEWELMHELDTGQNDESEYSSRANVGEVMPGAMSHLWLTLIWLEMGLGLNVSIINVLSMFLCYCLYML